MLNGAAVSWKNQRQQSVALSTAEAEYMALTAATHEAMFFKQLLHEFHPASRSPITIHEDNQSYIALSKNSMATGRSKAHGREVPHLAEEGGERGHRVAILCDGEHAC
jgi:hypothetical protein